MHDTSLQFTVIKTNKRYSYHQYYQYIVECKTPVFTLKTGDLSQLYDIVNWCQTTWGFTLNADDSAHVQMYANNHNIFNPHWSYLSHRSSLTGQRFRFYFADAEILTLFTLKYGDFIKF